MKKKLLALSRRNKILLAAGVLLVILLLVVGVMLGHSLQPSRSPAETDPVEIDETGNDPAGADPAEIDETGNDPEETDQLKREDILIEIDPEQVSAVSVSLSCGKGKRVEKEEEPELVEYLCEIVSGRYIYDHLFQYTSNLVPGPFSTITFYDENEVCIQTLYFASEEVDTGTEEHSNSYYIPIPLLSKQFTPQTELLETYAYQNEKVFDLDEVERQLDVE